MFEKTVKQEHSHKTASLYYDKYKITSMVQLYDYIEKFSSK